MDIGKVDIRSSGRIPTGKTQLQRGQRLNARGSLQLVGWVERSDTHQLHLMEMMSFAGSTHPYTIFYWSFAASVNAKNRRR
jgi:hypothetical protein